MLNLTRIHGIALFRRRKIADVKRDDIFSATKKPDSLTSTHSITIRVDRKIPFRWPSVVVTLIEIICRLAMVLNLRVTRFT